MPMRWCRPWCGRHRICAGRWRKRCKLRVAPDLTFTPDLALDYAMKIEELMHRPEIARDLQKDDQQEDDQQGDDPGKD